MKIINLNLLFYHKLGLKTIKKLALKIKYVKIKMRDREVVISRGS